jgi:hypothetical protein
VEALAGVIEAGIDSFVLYFWNAVSLDPLRLFAAEVEPRLP